MQRLAAALVRHRCAAMSWHSRTWPGKLAAFASQDSAFAEAALEDLREDARALEQARTIAPVQPWLQKVLQKSPLQTALMREVLDLATSPSRPSDQVVLEELASLAQALFSGWGQSKIVED
eukprot:8650992-Lingulodinium_polyedra.AAC.1